MGSSAAAPALICGSYAEVLDSTKWFKINPVDQYIEVDIA
jgi:hypothetical protein